MGVADAGVADAGVGLYLVINRLLMVYGSWRVAHASRLGLKAHGQEKFGVAPPRFGPQRQFVLASSEPLATRHEP